MANRNTTRCSIELEPRTLNEGQLSQARKVAEDVMQKMEPMEASCLFTEGLENSEEEVITVLDEGEEVVEKPVGCLEKIEDIIEEKACNISLYPSVVVVDSPSDDQLLHIHQHEPLSAPF
ncbi:uncharacterized protein LOC114735428 [Neltuma alba]|uniref:uncharacterized protein LOC114735428 n=1 Tax=Neltuma alba TaxID=207710 RepID=UPI0010A42379|nr:uncharacterized protein LOC114735428 [Prosopis alba]